MSPIAITLLITSVLFVLYIIIIYNRLVNLKHNAGMAWSNIEVLLKQRHDELPKLVETCKQYMSYERDTLEAVMRARQAVSDAQQTTDLPALGQAESQLRLGLGRLFAVAEAYPELRASDNFRHLETRITGLENAIADRREFYNDSVNMNNVRIEQFPDVLIARMFNFGPFRLLEFTEPEKQDVDLARLFREP
ncbi:MAG TPA: LemA family protein [Candidatus Competibacteraceae bacterium]|nr:LemA family protein [Candidatus Competibacteraceae bacterium]